MLKDYAAQFYKIGEILEALTRPTEDGVGFGDEDKEALSNYLKLLSNRCRDVGLDLAAMAVDRIDVTGFTSYDALRPIMPEIQRRIEDELKARHFLYIPKDSVAYYNAANLFGDVVATKFPRINGDVEEAGKCLATGRYTGAVFHLMRVMEVLVQTFGQKLKVSFTTEKVWQNILDEINKAIRNLPAKTTRQKSKQSAYAEVAAHLFTVKVAWRNPVMHPKATYTAEEAEDVFRSVKAFATHYSLIG